MDWRVCIGAAVLAACFIKPGPPGAHDDAALGDGNHSGDASNDSNASSDAATGFQCGHIVQRQNFVGMTLSDCGSWATTTPLQSVSDNGTSLVMMIQPSLGSSCLSKTASSGAFIKLDQAPAGPTNSLYLQANLQSNQHVTIRVVSSAAMIELVGPDATVSMTWDPSMDWLRLSADSATQLIGQYSTDGVNWAKLGTQPTNGAPVDNMRMEFGVDPGSSAGGSGSIYEYDECR